MFKNGDSGQFSNMTYDNRYMSRSSDTERGFNFHVSYFLNALETNQ